MPRRNPDNRFPSPLRHWRARRFARGCRPDFPDVERYCQFIGFPYSGHTLIGSLLNSLPDAVIAHEADALGMIAAGAGREALFEGLLRAEWRFADGGFRWWGYDYSVPGQWQGRYRRLRVIGDKKGGRSARRLQAEPALLERLRRTVAVPLRLVINTRHPYDNIARIATRKRLGLDDATGLFFVFADGVEQALQQSEPGEVILFRHEDFIADPAGWLSRLADFLGVGQPEGWARACAARVFESPRRARDEAEWTAPRRERVREAAARYRFLRDYQY
jgi:hypothetical protein